MAVAGFGHTDVVEAVEADLAARDRSVDHEEALSRLSAEQLGHGWVRITIGILGALMIFTGVMSILEVLREGGTLFAIAANTGVALLLWSFGGVLVLSAAGVDAIRQRLGGLFANSPERKRRVTRAFWASKPIGWLLALARKGARVKGPAPGPMTSNAPTAVLVAQAVTDLFDALPEHHRRALGAVPEALGTLERAAARLRERRNRLDDAIAAVGESGSGRRATVAADLEKEKAGVEARLTMALEAMENLRLDLLKLRAGLGTTGDLTEALEAARRIGEEVDIIADSRAETARLA